MIIFKYAVPLILAAFITAYLLAAGATFSVKYGNQAIHTPLSLKCVKISKKVIPEAGLGNGLRKNQLAAFIASHFAIKLQFPSNDNVFGYDFGDLFDNCSQIRNPRSTSTDQCTLQEEDVRINWCPRGDCECLARQIRPTLEGFSRNGCRVLTVESEGFKTLTYSGCIGNLLQRVFPSTSPPLQCDYDVVHYRQGDLAHRPNAPKSFQPHELWFLLRELCGRSDRPIVVITQGSPDIPQCPDRQGGQGRIILAADTSVQDAFRIMRYANSVATSQSSFAMAMLEMAKPKRVVIRMKEKDWMEWIDADKWTLVSNLGTAVHFESKKDFMEYAYSSRDPNTLRYKAGDVAKMYSKHIRNFHPSKKWSMNMKC